MPRLFPQWQVSKYTHIYIYLPTNSRKWTKKMKTKKKNLPCNRFSVSQNFCNSWKYLSKMYTFDIPLPNCWFCEFVAVVDITLFLIVIFTNFSGDDTVLFLSFRQLVFTSFYFISLYFFDYFHEFFFPLLLFCSNTSRIHSGSQLVHTQTEKLPGGSV